MRFSCASIIRPMAIPWAILFSASSPLIPSLPANSDTMPGVLSVRIKPGWTTVTLMPDGPSSSARFLVMAATATFLILPTTELDCRAANPLMLMIRPQPCWPHVGGLPLWRNGCSPLPWCSSAPRKSSSVVPGQVWGAGPASGDARRCSPVCPPGPGQWPLGAPWLGPLPRWSYRQLWELCVCRSRRPIHGRSPPKLPVPGMR